MANSLSRIPSRMTKRRSMRSGLCLGLAPGLVVVTIATLFVTGRPGLRADGIDKTRPGSDPGGGAAVQPTESSPTELGESCEAGDVAACVNLAVAYDKGSAVETDKAQAASLYARACELGEPFSCTRAAAMYDGDGEMPGGPDRSGALRRLSVPLYQKACDQERASACVNLAEMYASGRGIERDSTRALELRARACSLDAGSCFDLANAYYRGEGTPKDLGKAAESFKAACDHGSAPACFLLARIVEQDPESEGGQKAALSLYERACSAGFEPACRDAKRLEHEPEDRQ